MVQTDDKPKQQPTTRAKSPYEGLAAHQLPLVLMLKTEGDNKPFIAIVGGGWSAKK